MVWRVLACLCAIGCGPQVVDGDNGSTSSDPGTSEESGDANSSGSESGSLESSGPMVACEQFFDPREPAKPVVIEIVNVGANPLMLDAPCFNYDYLDLAAPSGAYWPGGFCESTCQGQFIDGCIVCAGCAATMYTVLMPGASTQIEWPAELYATVMPPEACFAHGSCSDGCPQKVTDIQEIVNVRVEAVAYEDCITVADPSMCSCADTPTCDSYAEEPVEATIFGNAIYEPGNDGPIIVELSG